MELSRNCPIILNSNIEIIKELGQGGCGIVFLARDIKLGRFFAIKTFKDQFLENWDVRKRFEKEALIWIKLEPHPYLIHPFFVEKISGRLFIGMPYIPKNADGYNTLREYLEKDPPKIVQSIIWAIQFCVGMVYVNNHGIISHRDIKPENIFIDNNKNVRIADFGLSKSIDEPVTSACKLTEKENISHHFINLTNPGDLLGTQKYMSPEQFRDPKKCDIRSDIYSFGLVLYELASFGGFPFDPIGEEGESYRDPLIPYEWKKLHTEYQVPQLDSPFNDIIQKCLRKEPDERYQNFLELHQDLAVVYQSITGKTYSIKRLLPPRDYKVEVLISRGVSLDNLSYYEKALACYNEAIDLDPSEIKALINKAYCLNALGRFDESIQYSDEALRIDRKSKEAIGNKGASLFKLHKYEEAIQLFDTAIELEQWDSASWMNKGTCLLQLDRCDEAINCFTTAIDLNPNCSKAYVSRGNTLGKLEQYQAAVENFNQALKIDPFDKKAWNDKAIASAHLKDFESALECSEKSLEIDNKYCDAYLTKSTILLRMGRKKEAIESLNQLLRINPFSQTAWKQKGVILYHIGKLAESLACFDKVLESNPLDPETLENKLICIKALGN